MSANIRLICSEQWWTAPEWTRPQHLMPHSPTHSQSIQTSGPSLAFSLRVGAGGGKGDTECLKSLPSPLIGVFAGLTGEPVSEEMMLRREKKVRLCSLVVRDPRPEVASAIEGLLVSVLAFALGVYKREAPLYRHVRIPFET